MPVELMTSLFAQEAYSSNMSSNSQNGNRMEELTKVTLQLNQATISRIDELKTEWGTNSRAVIIERIIEEVFEIKKIDT